MAVRIESEHVAAEVNGVIVATARWSWYAAADGSGAWVASTHPKRPFRPGDLGHGPGVTAGQRSPRRRPARDLAPPGTEVVTDRLIRVTTALAVLMVASVAAIISYQHAYELVTTHGETGITARLLPFTVDD